MPRLGAPESRPAEGHVTIGSTPAMDAHANQLAGKAALFWLGGNRPRVNAATMSKAIAEQSGLDEKLFRVIPHYPEDFFVTFEHMHHHNIATATARFRHADLDIHCSNWRLLTRTDAAQMHHHVHLCLEEVPLQAWNEEVVGKIIGQSCITHYFDIATVNKEDASTLNLWAWTANPSSIPKVMWVTIAGNSVTVSPAEPGGRRGLTSRVLVHLDFHEDLTPDANGRAPSCPYREKFDWLLGVVDGEREMRERRHENQGRQDHRRRNDDDRDHRDCDRH
jgi:hypothetical protein